jgi:hypothetical protein
MCSFFDNYFWELFNAVLILVYSPIVIIALVENLTSAAAGATVGACSRAVTVGLISGAAVTKFETRDAIRVVENYPHIPSIVSILFLNQGLLIIISTLPATTGAYVGATIYAGIIGCVLRGFISDMVTTVSKAITFGAFFGALAGKFGAIIGSIMGACYHNIVIRT